MFGQIGAKTQILTKISNVGVDYLPIIKDRAKRKALIIQKPGHSRAMGLIKSFVSANKRWCDSDRPQPEENK